MIKNKIELMLRFYYNDHDAKYFTALEFLIEEIRRGEAFESARNIALKKAQDHFEDMTRQMLELEDEDYSESEIKFAIEEAKNSYPFLWVFNEMTAVYETYGDEGLYQLFFVKYQAMRDERYGLDEDDEDY
ncbi:hypothetical protein DS229_24635 [Salmonella enterica subsp. enterica serovar Larochelle]|nr:hypothetical protein [Salmonella enterica subsp. enterica serovar Larochelle]